jgi:hypothetical protein
MAATYPFTTLFLGASALSHSSSSTGATLVALRFAALFLCQRLGLFGGGFRYSWPAGMHSNGWGLRGRGELALGSFCVTVCAGCVGTVRE